MSVLIIRGHKRFSEYVRRCKRCNDIYKTNQKHSNYCERCFNPIGKHLSNVQKHHYKEIVEIKQKL